MHFESKKTSLVIMGLTALTLSRLLFALFNDPEGPNLLVVFVAAVIIYVPSLVAYWFASPATGAKKLLLATIVQTLVVVGLYILGHIF